MPSAENSLEPQLVDAVAFDIGGVFLDWDPRYLYRKLIPDEDDRERFLLEVCSPAWHAEQDLGRGIADSCGELARTHPDQAELIWAWANRNEEMVGAVIEGSVEILHQLRLRGVKCYALSNMEREAFASRLARYSFLSEFDGWVVSGQEGVAKPSEEIFRRLLSRFGLDATRTLFVDDRKLNVDAAEALGFRTCLFSTPSSLRGALSKWRLLD